MSNNGNEIWAAVRDLLAESLSKHAFDRWIAVMEFDRAEEGTLYLSVPSGLYIDWVEDNYIPLIKKAARAIDSGLNDVELLVDRGRSLPKRKKKSSQGRRSAPLPITAARCNESLNGNYSFENFVVGSSNSFSHAASLAVAQAPAKAYNPLFIYGGVGLGKTHLMHAIGNYVFQKKKKSVCYISSECFVNEYISALQNRNLVKFRNKYRKIDVLLIDDIHFLTGKERMQEEFFHTFNSLHNNDKQIVLTSDKAPGDLSGLENRLVSRFEWGMVTQLESPDLETRIAILKSKASEFEAQIPEETIMYLAENISSHVRRLEGSLIKIASYMSLKNISSISQSELENLIHDILEQEKPPVLSLESIQRRVAECFQIEHSDILGKCRTRNIALPRQVAMYLCREMTDSSFPAIGFAFKKNHATILHACKSIECNLNKNSDLRNTVLSIKKSLSSG